LEEAQTLLIRISHTPTVRRLDNSWQEDGEFGSGYGQVDD